MPDNLSADPIKQRIAELGEWFQNLNLRGQSTAPHHFLGDYPAKKWRAFANALPPDLRGLTVLDVGCNAGFYSIEMKRRGADRVVGIDWDERYLAQARFAAQVCEVDIEYRELSIYDVAALGERFDVVLFMGVLYHLRHPLLALDLLHEHVTRDVLVFQSMLRGSRTVEPVAADYPFEETAVFDTPGFPRLHFVERAFSGDSTNWWIPNRAAAEAMLRSAGYELVAHPEAEVFICRHVDVPGDWPRAVYPHGRPHPFATSPDP
jgi:tRNA (mo5U34)-methyltransferase